MTAAVFFRYGIRRIYEKKCMRGGPLDTDVFFCNHPLLYYFTLQETNGTETVFEEHLLVKCSCEKVGNCSLM